ncbi:MAG: transporter substrate-binding domain-containing protein [Actinophytocola sp.]|uniref:glutamate ABC transporter substrate-binding protein n=1 Tax=Actinophytocola sp. TaxID=1872138 RepID=UPI001323C12F|nr:glutamate ABC transporter substrate-binding protein [Actinophytocola sp.]MPZ81077.1 transporter substrate-binding domain-containing protein [Actinophytocola sp.]
MSNKRGAVVLSLLLACATGCAGGGRPVDLAAVDSVERPAPVGVEENPAPPSTSAAPTPNCDPEASFRPPESMPQPGRMPAGSTMKAIQDSGKLIAGVDQNTFLFGFRDPTTNALEGFDIDRVREIAKAIFGDPNKVQFKVVTSAGRIDALKNNQVHIVVRTMTATCARWQQINFSAIYYTAGQRLLVDRASKVTSLDQLGGKKVCAAKGSTSIKTIAEHKADPIPVQVDNWSDCLIMLQQGQVDAMSTDDTILAGMVAQDPNVKMVGPRITREPYGIGIPKKNVDMVQFVNGVLAQSVADGAWADSYDKWLGPTGEPRPDPPTPKYRD